MEEGEPDFEDGDCSDEEDYSESADDEEEDQVDRGLFGDELAAAKKFNRDTRHYAREAVARGEMTSAEAYHFLQHELVDISGVDEMVTQKEKELKEEYADIDQRLQAGEIDPFSAELKKEQILAKEAKIKHKLGLLSVGLTYEDLGDLSDDAMHVVGDAYDPESRELRKDIRKKMKDLSPQEKKKLLADLVESDKIDERDYNELFLDFM
jgi:hypothetical protein